MRTRHTNVAAKLEWSWVSAEAAQPRPISLEINRLVSGVGPGTPRKGAQYSSGDFRPQAFGNHCLGGGSAGAQGIYKNGDWGQK